jgi:hypothetical protein
VAKAAALASGRLASPLPIKIMQDTVKRTKGPAPSAMVAGLFAAANTLRERRQWKGAMEIYDVLRAAQLAPHERVIAWRGTILSGAGDAPRLLLEALCCRWPTSLPTHPRLSALPKQRTHRLAVGHSRHYEAVKKMGQAPSRLLIFQDFHRFGSEPVLFFHSLYLWRHAAKTP